MFSKGFSFLFRADAINAEIKFNDVSSKKTLKNGEKEKLIKRNIDNREKTEMKPFSPVCFILLEEISEIVTLQLVHEDGCVTHAETTYRYTPLFHSQANLRPFFVVPCVMSRSKKIT